MKIGKKYFENEVELEAKAAKPEIVEDGQDKPATDDAQSGDEDQSTDDGVQGKEDTDAEPSVDENADAEKPQKRGRKTKMSE